MYPMRFLEHVTLTGYISGYIRIHLVSWTLHHDTSRYTEIQNHDTCILDASWRHFKIQSGYIKDTFGIHAGTMRDCCVVGAPTRSPLGGRDVGFPIVRFGGFPIRYVSYCILMYLAVYLDVSRSYTSRYTKIHQDTSSDTFVSISLAIMEMYLTLGYVSFFTIHSRYIQDTRSGYNVS